MPEPDYQNDLVFPPEERNKVKYLKSLLKECRNIVVHDLWSRAQFPDGQDVEKDDLLERLDAALKD